MINSTENLLKPGSVEIQLLEKLNYLANENIKKNMELLKVPQ